MKTLPTIISRQNITPESDPVHYRHGARELIQYVNRHGELYVVIKFDNGHIINFKMEGEQWSK
jgi:hypothetical protein